MGVTKTWTGSSDMAFYYGDGSTQKATNVGVWNDMSTRYGQVLWFTTDASGGVGFTFNWNPKAFAGYQKTVYCRISKTGQNSSGKWPGCTNGSGDISYTVTSSGYQFSDNSFVFEPNTKYYIYINRSWIGNTVAEGYGVHYYANGDSYGTSSIAVHGASVHKLTTTKGTGVKEVSVVCTESPIGKTALNTALSNGATIYHGDKLKITFAANPGYSIETHTVNGVSFPSGITHTVIGNVAINVTAKILGAVHIEVNGVMTMYLVYIDTGSDWVQVAPYVDTGSGWSVCS